MLVLLAFSLLPGAFFAGYLVGSLRELARRHGPWLPRSQENKEP
jgi:hypothetical protein